MCERHLVRRLESEKLLNAIGKLDDNLIHGAVNDAPKKKTPVWVKWGAVAACFAVVLASAILFLPKEPGNISELPMISVDLGDVGMGYEGYMVYDISELVNNNPWNEDLEIKTLPVFKNPITFDETFHSASGADFDQMKARLLEVAAKLGYNTNTLVITDNATSEMTKQQMIQSMIKASIEEISEGMFDPTMLFIETEGGRLMVDLYLSITVTLDVPISLPDEYNITSFASYEKKAAVAEYLRKEYTHLIEFENPKINIYGGDYDTSGRQQCSIAFFDADGNDAEQIVNYSFNRIAFYGNDEGKLYLMRFFNRDLSKKVGDYPIITMEEAKELLSNSNYITTVQQKMPGMEYVHKAELVYRAGNEDEYHIPYYRFLVELPDKEHDGIKTYGAYYVPAISSEYISDIPLWDGTFNS